MLLEERRAQQAAYRLGPGRAEIVAAYRAGSAVLLAGMQRVGQGLHPSRNPSTDCWVFLRISGFRVSTNGRHPPGDGAHFNMCAGEPARLPVPRFA